MTSPPDILSKGKGEIYYFNFIVKNEYYYKIDTLYLNTGCFLYNCNDHNYMQGWLY